MVAPWSLPDVTTLTVHLLILDLKLIFRKDSNRQVCRVFLKANTERQGCPANVGGRCLPQAKNKYIYIALRCKVKVVTDHFSSP